MIEELGTVLARLTDNLSESTERKKGKEIVPEKTASRVDTGGPNTPAITSGQAAVMEWKTVERKKKAEKKTSAEKQPTKTTTGSGSKNPSKAPERGTGTAGKRGGKPPLREENMYLQGGQGEPVLQARWHRAPSQGMYSREPEMPALRGALLLLAMSPLHP
jgi:hypothetical protein